MIVIGDLHLKSKPAFTQANEKFLNYIFENFNDEVIFFLGDVMDSSSPMWSTYALFKKFLVQRNNKTYILQGNHDISKSKGSALNGMHLTDDVEVFFKETEFELEGYKCLALPHQYSMKHYENIEGNFDLIFLHITPEKFSFGSEYINVDKIKGIKIFGHIHEKDRYDDNVVVGVPMISRKGETSNPILRITKEKGIEEIIIPEFLRIDEIEFEAELPLNKDNLYIINNCPTRMLAMDKFKDYYIHEINLKVRNEEDYLLEEGVSFSSMTTKQKFDYFSKQESYNDDIRSYTFEVMDRIGI